MEVIRQSSLGEYFCTRARYIFVRSMEEMDAFLKQTGARLWINHDADQSPTLDKAPQYYE